MRLFNIFRKATVPESTASFAGRLPSTDAHSRIVRELIGPEVMDFESLATKDNSEHGVFFITSDPARKYTPKQISEFKKGYSDFVATVVKVLRDGGFEGPKNQDELLKLCGAIIPIVWSNFTYKESISLIDGFAIKADGLRGTLKCDSSAYVVSDILNQFGVNSKLVLLPKHVILHVADLYIETTSGVYYDSEGSFNERYPISYGECNLLRKNPCKYCNRGAAKGMLGIMPVRSRILTRLSP